MQMSGDLVFYCLFMYANEWWEKATAGTANRQWPPLLIAISAVAWTQAQVGNSNSTSAGKEKTYRQFQVRVPLMPVHICKYKYVDQTGRLPCWQKLKLRSLINRSKVDEFNPPSFVNWERNYYPEIRDYHIDVLDLRVLVPHRAEYEVTAQVAWVCE